MMTALKHIALVTLAVAGSLFAQHGAGRWEGAIQAPNGGLKFSIDLAPHPCE
jgi:hypothetical protein